MDRNQFLKQITLGLATLAVAPSTAIAGIGKSGSFSLGEMHVAGFQYYNGKKLLYQMQPGEPIELIREPENQFDEDAVAVYYRDQKIGYLPRAENQTIALLMDQQAPVNATIIEVNNYLNTSDWEKVWVEVRIG